ncbi:rhomboid-related protein 4-like isoform X2 [Archocentrus centrarchus]|nr:rhomboid-related protein 4-like isoform X2 [Archocentrus centrarchus]
MQRGFQVGLLLLLVQLFQEGPGNIPAITLAVLGFNVYLFVFPAAPPLKACMSLGLVYHNKEWRRLLLSPLHHIDEWHLYFNMASFLWKGVRLERRLGGGWFLYLLSVFFLLTGLVYLLLQALMIKLMEDADPSDPLLGHMQSLSRECVVGFSGVLFALKVVSNHFNPGGVTYVMNIRVSNRLASWAELVLIYLIYPGTSLVGHLAGILVGLLYTVGPLRTIMEACADVLSSDRASPRQHSYYSSSGYSGTRRAHGEEPRPAEDPTSDYSESFIAGLTEEEQIELAIRRSLNNPGRTRQRETTHDPEETEDLRRRRLRRFEQGVSNQRRGQW